jgi:hypothetical protein
MLTFWGDTDAVKRFAGEAYSKAKYYDFDSDYLIEKEAGVLHYEVSSQASPAPLRSGARSTRRIATVDDPGI